MQIGVSDAAMTLARWCTVAIFVATLAAAVAAPLPASPEDRYIAARDAAIEKISPGGGGEIAQQGCIISKRRAP